MGQMVLDMDFKEKAGFGSREAKLKSEMVRGMNMMCLGVWGRSTGLELKNQST